MEKLNNKYYLMRHGEALSNVKGICSSWPETFQNPLTLRGVAMVNQSAETLHDKSIDMIFASDILRTKETAEIVKEHVHAPIQFDERLREIGFGELNGKPIMLLDKMFADEAERIDKAMPGGETYNQVTARAYDFLKDIDTKQSGKTILIVSHESVLWMLECKVNGISLQEGLETIPREKRIHKAEIKELN